VQATPRALVYSGRATLLCEHVFRLQMYGQMSETVFGKATGAGIVNRLREENGFRQGRNS